MGSTPIHATEINFRGQTLEGITMNKRVVHLDEAKKLLSGHPRYINELEREYSHPNQFGNYNDIIQEMDDNSKDETDFEDQLFQCLEEMDDMQTRFVMMAMLGINPDDSHWG